MDYMTLHEENIHPEDYLQDRRHPTELLRSSPTDHRGHASPFAYLPASINVTLLISFSVVIPSRTRSRAESRKNAIPLSLAFFRISLPGFFASNISRISSSSSSNS